MDYGTNVDIRNGEGQAPLHIAAAEGDEVLVKYFYGVRASASITDNQDRTPMHLAAENGHANIIGQYRIWFVKLYDIFDKKVKFTTMHDWIAFCIIRKKGTIVKYPVFFYRFFFGHSCLNSTFKNNHFYKTILTARKIGQFQIICLKGIMWHRIRKKISLKFWELIMGKKAALYIHCGL